MVRELLLVSILLVGIAAVSCPVTHGGTASAANESDEVLGVGPPEGRGAEEEHEIDSRGVDADEGDLSEMERGGRTVSLRGAPLALFFESLGELERDGEGLVRVLHWGDSHTAADFLTTAIRGSLQARFGDGGRGFVLLGEPWPSYRPTGVEAGADRPWDCERILLAADPATLDGRYGLGGVAVETERSQARTWVATADEGSFGREAATFEIFYLNRPGGGSFRAFVDGRRRATVSTASREVGSGFLRLEVEQGEHRLEIRANGDGPIRLFGAVVESAGPGVVYDSLGINGAFTSTPLRWDADLLAEQVRRRDPSLIVAMYGTNDALARSLTPERYRGRVRQLISRLRAGAPQAACLLLGPPDLELGSIPDEEEGERESWMIDMQSQVAAERDCAFLDLRELMGGEGSRREWLGAGLARDDGIHLTLPGYLDLGEAIAEELLAAYDRHLDELEQGEEEKERS
ncbi:MAG: GDSL-type esterase/lipase family protein [Polyangia bacterium]